jgi:hypothetical protein
VCGVCQWWCWVPSKLNVGSGIALVKLQSAQSKLGSVAGLLNVVSSSLMCLPTMCTPSGMSGEWMLWPLRVWTLYWVTATLLVCCWSAGRVVGAWLVCGYPAVWGPVKGSGEGATVKRSDCWMWGDRRWRCTDMWVFPFVHSFVSIHRFNSTNQMHISD